MACGWLTVVNMVVDMVVDVVVDVVVVDGRVLTAIR